METLASLAHAVTESLELSEVLDRVAHAATELLPDSSARIWVMEGERLVLRAEHGPHGAPQSGFKGALAVGEGLTGRVAATGEILIVEDVADEPQAVMTQLRAEGKIRNRELGFRAKDGRWVETSASISLMQDPNGQVLGSLGVVRDITDRKKAEAAQREAEELRTITTLATTTAHEINNPLLVVKGRLEMLGPRLPDDSTERKWIEQSLIACARIQEMVARMQRIARVQYLEGESRSLPRLFDLRKASDTEESPGTPPPPASPKSR